MFFIFALDGVAMIAEHYDVCYINFLSAILLTHRVLRGSQNFGILWELYIMGIGLYGTRFE